jgi:von Willebrand factor type A domain
MRILGLRSRLRAAVLLLACQPALAGKCSNAVFFLNSVEHDLIIRRDIRAEDVEVTVNGHRERVGSISLNSRPRHIMMMVDGSGSMQPRQHSGWGLALRTAGFAVVAIPPDAAVALFTFSNKLQRESDGFEDSRHIGRRVLDLAKREPNGSTALFDSLDQALAQFEEPQLGDAVYLVTDGVDDKSEVSLKTLREKFVFRGVRLFVFLIPLEVHVSTLEEPVMQLEDLAEFTGGYVVRIPWQDLRGKEKEGEWLVRSATRLGDQVRAMYQVQLDIPSSASPTGRLKVVFADRKRDKNTLAYPRQLAPCLPDP